jgi:hypothetical protein
MRLPAHPVRFYALLVCVSLWLTTLPCHMAFDQGYPILQVYPRHYYYTRISMLNAIATGCRHPCILIAQLHGSTPSSRGGLLCFQLAVVFKLCRGAHGERERERGCSQDTALSRRYTTNNCNPTGPADELTSILPQG